MSVRADGLSLPQEGPGARAPRQHQYIYYILPFGGSGSQRKMLLKTVGTAKGAQWGSLPCVWSMKRGVTQSNPGGRISVDRGTVAALSTNNTSGMLVRLSRICRIVDIQK